MSSWKINFQVQGSITIEPLISPDTTQGVIVFNTEGKSQMGEITVPDTETTLRASVTFRDAEGHETLPDQVPTWEISDPEVLTCNPADDGLSATFVVGAPGVSNVVVRTMETHEGVGTPTEIMLTGLVTVIAGDVVTGSVDFATG